MSDKVDQQRHIALAAVASATCPSFVFPVRASDTTAGDDVVDAPTRSTAVGAWIRSESFQPSDMGMMVERSHLPWAKGQKRMAPFEAISSCYLQFDHLGRALERPLVPQLERPVIISGALQPHLEVPKRMLQGTADEGCGSPSTVHALGGDAAAA